MEGLKDAIWLTSDYPYRRTFHSDQGWTYQMKVYDQTSKQHKIFQSMSQKENFLDNSPMESFLAF